MTTVRTEYRLLLPLTLEQYNISQLYIATKLALKNTDGDSSIKILENIDYEHEVLGKCRKTLKLMNLNSKVPYIIRKLAPSKKALQLEETAYNAFPRCSTSYRNLYFNTETLSITVDSMHVQGFEYKDNVFNLPCNIYKDTKIKYIDISKNPDQFNPCESTYKPLSKDWTKEDGPKLCSYKHIEVSVNKFGMGWIAGEIDKQMAKLFLHSHQQLYCEMEEWINMDINDIRRMEEKSKEELDKRDENNKDAD